MPLAYAGLRPRAAALLWDALILLPLTAPLAWAAPLYAAIPAVLYFTALECAPRQASFGKRRLRLKVIEANGRPVGAGRAAARAVLKIIPFAALSVYSPWLLALAAILLAFTLQALLAPGRHRTWYDRAAGTSVICLPRDP